MNGNLPALLLLLFTICVAAPAQSPARLQNDPSKIERETALATQALVALRRLDQEVVVYRSLGEFVENGKLARVTRASFEKDLQAVTNEVEPILSSLPQGRLKSDLRNALASYRDGAFWWEKIDQPRVVDVSALRLQPTQTASEAGLLESVPYTVAIHWRQANRYLKRADASLKLSK